jgi:hypothetical protein
VNRIKKAARYIYNNPSAPGAKALIELAVAIEHGSAYTLGDLNDLNHEEFELAIGMIKDWRVDRHYLSKLRMLEIAEMDLESPEA